MERKSSSEESGIDSDKQQHHHCLQSDSAGSKETMIMMQAPTPRRTNTSRGSIFRHHSEDLARSDLHLAYPSTSSSTGEATEKSSQQKKEDSSPSSNDTLESQAHSDQSALAASLPVAASFHPAELFESHSPRITSTTGTFNHILQSMLPSTAGEFTSTTSMLNATTEQALRLASSQQFSMIPRSLLPSRYGPNRIYPRAQGYVPQAGPLPFSSFNYPQRTTNEQEPDSMSGVSAALEHLGRRSHSTAEHDGHGARRRSSSDLEDPDMLSRIVTAASAAAPPEPSSSSTAAHSSSVASSLQNHEEPEAETDSKVAASRTTRGEEIFPMTLHRLLIDLESSDGGTEIARFILPDGKSFIVEDVIRFESEVMPEYFPRMNRLSSFQRQLNLYNFARVLGTGPDRGAYYHEFFLRDKPELASTIRRTKIKGRFTVPLEKRRNRKKQLGSPLPSKSPDEQPSSTKQGQSG